MLAQKKKVGTKKTKVAKFDDLEGINVFSVDKKYCYTSFNKSHWQETKRIWNVEIKEGTNLLDIINIPEVKKTAKSSIDRALKGELFSEVQHLPDGARSYEVFWTPIYNNDEVIGVTVFAKHSEKLNKIEKELRQSEERYRSILLASPDNITITEIKGRIVMGSPSGVSMFGFDDESEIIGHFLYEYILPEERERVAANIAEMFAGEKRGANEYRGVRKDGSIFDIEVNGKFIKGENGERYQMIFIVRDISERKRAAAELLNSKNQYDTLVARIPIGVYIIRSKPNGEFNFEYVSPRMAEILNESIDNIIKDSLVTFNPFHPDDKLEFINLNIKVLKSGEPLTWTGRLLIDGNIKWIHIVSTPELQENGELFWHGVMTDITKKKEVEKALQEREKDLKKAQKIAKIGSWEWSPLTDKIVYSDEIYNQFGVEKDNKTENFVNLVDSYIHPEDKEIVRKAGEVASLKGTGQTIEYRIIRADAEQRWIRSIGEPVFENGQLVKFFGTSQDITDRRLAKEKLRESEIKYRELVENSPNAIVIYIDGKIVFCNKQLAKLIAAKSVEDLLGKEVLSFVHTDYKTLVIERMKEVASGKSLLPFTEEKFIRMDGTEVYAEVKAIAIQYENKNAVQLIISEITERKRAEEALEESWIRYRGLSDASFDAIFFSEKGICIEQNNTAETMFGYTTEEALGRYGTEWLIPEDRKMVMNNMLSGYLLPYEATALRKDGSTFPCQLRAKMMKFKGKEIRVTSLTDITQLKLAETALEKSELMLKESQEVAHLGTYVWDLATDKWISSKILDDIFGIDENYVRSLEGWTNIIHRDFLNQMNEYVTTEVMVKHMPFYKEYKRIKQSTGEEYWVHGLGRLELNENNEPLKLFGTISDITHRKQGEEYQSLSNEILRILNSGINLKDMIDIVLSTIKRETKLSAVALRLKKEDDYPYFIQHGFSDNFIRTEDSIIAKDCNGGIYKDKDGVPLLECTCGLVISGRTMQNNALFTNAGSFFTNDSHTILEIPQKSDPRLHPRNKCIHVGYGSFAIIPILVNENILGTLQLNEKKKNAFSKEMIQFFEGVCLNIGTALMRKQAEESLKNKMDELLVINKKLEQFAHANKELEQFAYLASHDLKEPLRTVENYIQLFEDDYEQQLDEKGRKYLHTVIAATKRMSILIRTLLEFSQLGINKKLSLVDCKSVIEDVITDLDSVINSSGALIEVSDMPKINLYESEIRQVFQNLITNAIKFRKKDAQPIIKINSEKVKEGWKFSISDNGIGIAPAYYNRVFEIFQRLHTNREYEGSGIGLANCKKIVQLHLGEIWIESTEGEGSTFNFTIPKL